MTAGPDGRVFPTGGENQISQCVKHGEFIIEHFLQQLYSKSTEQILAKAVYSSILKYTVKYRDRN